MRTLLLNEIEAIGGGIAIGKLVHWAHGAIGVIELTNYTLDWAITGCSNTDESDWVRKGGCAVYAYAWNIPAYLLNKPTNELAKTEL